MAKNKYTFYTIIFLLVICFPCAIYGMYMNHKINNHSKHELKYGDKLSFYNNNTLLGTYTCSNKDCDYATLKNNTKTSIINNSYAFIKDDSVLLFDISNNNTIDYFDSVDLLDKYYLVTKDNLSGVVSFEESYNILLDIKYNSISYKDGLFKVEENNTSIITDGNNELYSTRDSIKDFNSNYIIVRNATSSYDTLYDYNENIYFISDVANDDITFMEDYFLIKRQDTYYIYTISEGKETFVDSFTYDNNGLITYKVVEGKIEIYAGNDLQKTIELNQ